MKYFFSLLFTISLVSMGHGVNPPDSIGKIAPISTFRLAGNLYFDKKDLRYSDWVSFISSPFLIELNLIAPEYDDSTFKFILIEGYKHPNKIIQSLPIKELMLYIKWRNTVVNHFKKQFTTGMEGCSGNKYYEQFRTVDPNNEWQICYELAPDSILTKYRCKGIRCIAYYKKNTLIAKYSQ